jgi:hypothetical protein
MALNSTPPHLSKKNGAKIATALSFFSLALTVSASAGSVALPADATARSERANSCEKVFVPADAYLNDPGTDWKCRRGFKKTNDRCTKIALPEHGSIDASGNDWKCSAPYRRKGGACVPS